MTTHLSFAGVSTELLPPFDKDGSIAFDLLDREIERQIEAGVTGLYTNGFASEVIVLEPAERVALASRAVQVAAGRVPVMANIVASSPAEADAVLRDYEASGVDAISIQAPIVYTVPQDELYEYFDRLAKATSLPVALYNAPQTGSIATPATIARLFSENENVRYLKESVVDFLHVQTVLRFFRSRPDLEFLNGTDATTASVMKLGGKGVISLVSAVFPELVMAVVNAQTAEEADAAQDVVLKIRQALKTGPVNAGYKFASSLMGVPLGHMRRPMAELSQGDKEKITGRLRDLGLLN